VFKLTPISDYGCQFVFYMGVANFLFHDIA